MNNPDRNPARAIAFRTALAVGALTATDAVLAGQVDAQNAATNPNCKITLNGKVEPAGSRVNVKLFDGRNNELIKEITLPASIEIVRGSNASTKRPSSDNRTATELASFTTRVQVVDQNSKDPDVTKGNEINTVCNETNGFTITVNKDVQATAAVATRVAQASLTPTRTPEQTAVSSVTPTGTPDTRTIPEALATAQAKSIEERLAKAKILAQKGDTKEVAQIIESVRKDSASALSERSKLEQTLEEIEKLKNGTPVPTRPANPSSQSGASTGESEIGIVDLPAKGVDAVTGGRLENPWRAGVNIIGNTILAILLVDLVALVRGIRGRTVVRIWGPFYW